MKIKIKFMFLKILKFFINVSKLVAKELHDLYSSPSIMRIIKSRRMI
jgi:hypothetical protein